LIKEFFMSNLMIKNGILITMDPDRRIIENGAVAISDDKIVAVGRTEDVEVNYQAEYVIDAKNKVIMPGLIDGHSHAGHALLKTIGVDIDGVWSSACEKIYQYGSDEEFWYAEAQLSGLERLKCGTTTSVNILGGGHNVMRTDHEKFGKAHCSAIQKIGIREILAVGPGTSPFPKRFSDFYGEARHDEMISFEKQMSVCENLIQSCHLKGDKRISIAVSFHAYRPEEIKSPTHLQEIKSMAREARSLSKKYGLLFVQDSHRRGTILFADRELDLLGPDALLGHSVNITAEEIELCRQTDTKIAHNPSAIVSMLGRCPVAELLDAGVTVLICSDAGGPDRSYDMFRHMFQFMRYHRTYYRDSSYLPAGKTLEMVTIDAAKGLGMENEIGSLEIGKQADIILVDMYKPHLFPLNMPAYRIAYFANGSDVDTVIVGGEILMENRKVKRVSESEILDLAQKAAETAIRRNGLEQYLEAPDRFWGHSKL
jgi:5-methylthioadenosine/S-adenosylhomocysteine deaminase